MAYPLEKHVNTKTYVKRKDTHTIYIYSTETYRQFRNWHKVGQTAQLAKDRVAQQDSTSSPEPLEISEEFEVPIWLTDTTIHAQLEKMGYKKTRIDKNREWFDFSDDDPNEVVATAINALLTGVSRPNNYGMRPEQGDCHNKAVRHYKSGGKQFLMDAIMRFGKTFTTYQIIKTMKYKKVLVLTYKPAVEASWREDLEFHVDFADMAYAFAGEFNKTNVIELPNAKTSVLFASFQDANKWEEKDKWSDVIHEEFDLIVVDESHYGADTELAKSTLAAFDPNDTAQLLYVSGTPLKAIIRGDFLPEETYTWSYVDEQAKRTEEELTGWATEIYRWLPKMKFMILELDDAIKDQVMSVYDDDEGFSMMKFTGSDDGITLNDEASVKLWADQFFGKTVRKTNSPIRTYAPDHLVIRLPALVKNATAFSNFLEKYCGNEYHIINASGNNVTDLQKVKQAIAHYDKSITVSIGRFTTGVTIPEWDMAVMLDDGKSPEEYFQFSFRIKSGDKDRRKETCTVVDYNPIRAFEMIFSYCELTAKPAQSTPDAMREFLEFAPVLDHSGNTPVEINIGDILSHMAQAGDYAYRFGNTTMFNWNNISDLDSIDLTGVSPIDILTVLKKIAENDLVKGKNFVSNMKNTKKAITNMTNDEISHIKKLVQGLMLGLPKYLLIEDKLNSTNIESIADINNADNALFKEVMKVSIDDFEILCNGLIKEDRLNRCIVSYNMLEELDI